MGKKTSLPKDATVGTTIKKTVNVKGNKRRLTFKRVSTHEKNKNLAWRITSNKSASKKK